MTNPETKVADVFDLEVDPLQQYNEGMQTIDADLFDYYYKEHIETRDIKDSTKAHYKRAYRDWTEFMQQYDRHPTLPSEDHVEAFVDDCLERMGGGACRDKLNYINDFYEWMQRSSRYPHPTNYNPFLIIINKREDDLKETEPDDYPKLLLDDIKAKVEDIKHIGERAATVFQLKTGVRSTELSNIRFEDIHITNADVLSHYDGSEGQNHEAMGSHDQLDNYTNAVYIPLGEKRDRNKRKMPTVIPLDDETRRVLIDWLLIRPDNGSPYVFLTKKGKKLDRNSLRHIWTNHWHPEYKYADDEEYRSISPHYARHWMSTWFRTKIDMAEMRVQYLRGDKTGPDIDSSRSAIHRYIQKHYEHVEEEYRKNVFKLGI